VDRAAEGKGRGGACDIGRDDATAREQRDGKNGNGGDCREAERCKSRHVETRAGGWVAATGRRLATPILRARGA
jgi:hypothetical protein